MVAEQGIKELRKHVDSLIIVPNDKLLENLRGAKLMEAFKAANGVLHGAVQGIAELITSPGIINVDFADVRTVMSEKGMAMMGSGIGNGENRAREAAELAIASPFLENVDLSGARGILVNVTAGDDLGLEEYAEVGNIISEFAAEDATVVIGTSIDPALNGQLRVTVVATGLGREQELENEAPKASVRVVESNSEPKKAEEAVNYDELEVPTITRKQNPVKTAVGAIEDMDYLDIPAFLRKQNN